MLKVTIACFFDSFISTELRSLLNFRESRIVCVPCAIDRVPEARENDDHVSMETERRHLPPDVPMFSSAFMPKIRYFAARCRLNMCNKKGLQKKVPFSVFGFLLRNTLFGLGEGICLPFYVFYDHYKKRRDKVVWHLFRVSYIKRLVREDFILKYLYSNI